MKALLLAIVKKMVNQPEQVTINEIDGKSGVVFELAVAKRDLGTVIGQKGKNISAIRTLVQAAAGKQKKQAVINLLE